MDFYKISPWAISFVKVVIVAEECYNYGEEIGKHITEIIRGRNIRYGYWHNRYIIVAI